MQPPSHRDMFPGHTTTARNGCSCGAQRNWGGPALLDCHLAQLVLPYQLGPASHSMETSLGQLEGSRGAQSISLPWTIQGKFPVCGATPVLAKAAVRAQHLAGPSWIPKGGGGSPPTQPPGAGKEGKQSEPQCLCPREPPPATLRHPSIHPSTWTPPPPLKSSPGGAIAVSCMPERPSNQCRRGAKRGPCVLLAPAPVAQAALDRGHSGSPLAPPAGQCTGHESLSLTAAAVSPLWCVPRTLGLLWFSKAPACCASPPVVQEMPLYQVLHCGCLLAH